MYKNQRKYQPKNRSTGGSNEMRPRFGSKFGGNRGRSSFGPKRRIKVLDPNMFIKKAVVTTVEEEVSTAKFMDFALSEKLQRNIADHGYVTPTPIQEKTIPSTLLGRDMIGIANTGTGKTAAFLIPLVDKAHLDRSQRILIVTPTRELAMQIVDELKFFTRGMDLDSALLIGGANMFRQTQKLRHNPHFVIGTPGRIKDMIERKKLNLQLFNNVVLDEVDRMLDIGFIRDVEYFISQLPKERQSLFFSATVSDKVRGIMNSFLTNPETVSIKQQSSSENVDQDIIRVQGDSNKQEKLHDLLNQEGFDKVLIFGRTKWGIEKLTKVLQDKGFKAAAIHGNKSQGQRQRALTEFKQNRVQILLATDVASRGIDIDNVTHVINYDAPESYEDYIHRIGRTGRAGRKGVALTFVN